MESAVRVQPRWVFRLLWLGVLVLWIAAYLLLANVVWDNGGSRGLRTGLAYAGLIVALVGFAISAGSVRTLFRSPPGSDFGGGALLVPSSSRLGPRGEIFTRLFVGVVFLVVSVLRAAGPKLDYLPEDPRGNAGYWELFGLAFAIAGAAVLASTLIKIRVRREG